MSTENLVNYELIKANFGSEGVVLAKVLIGDMMQSHQEGFIGCYSRDPKYTEVSGLIKKLLRHLKKHEGAYIEEDHLVSVKGIDSKRVITKSPF